MADCPKCGYALQPFDKTCPRCARQGEGGAPQDDGGAQREIQALLSERKAPPRAPGRAPRRQLLLGGIAGAVILAGGTFIFLQLYRPGSAFWSNRLAGDAPQATSTGVVRGGPASTRAGSGTSPAGEADTDRRELLRECPFELRVGAEVAVKQAATEVRLDENEGQVGAIESGAWRLQGVGGQLLQMEQQTTGSEETGDLTTRLLWQDQPFEVYQNGQLVARFANTSEYWAAQQ